MANNHQDIALAVLNEHEDELRAEILMSAEQDEKVEVIQTEAEVGHEDETLPVEEERLVL